MAGYTQSQDFPTTPNALQPAFAGDGCDINDSDAFILKITADNLAPAGLRSVWSDPTKAGSRDPRGAGAMDAAFLAMLALLASVAVLRRRGS